MMSVRSPLVASALIAVAAVAWSATVATMARNLSPPGEMRAPASDGVPLDRGWIGAVGIVEPASEEIRIGISAPAIVTEVFAHVGDQAARGDKLLSVDSRIESALLEERRRELASAEARLALARARLPELTSEVDMAKAALEAARADCDEALDLMRVAGALKARKVISDREATRRGNGLHTALARLAEASARLAQAEANLNLFDEGRGGAAIALEAAGVAQAQAAVRLAESALKQRTVTAPEDATVLQVNVHPGELAEATDANGPLMVLGRLQPLHVRVEIDETDIPGFRPGASASATVRGGPGAEFALRFIRVEPLVVPKRVLSGRPTERADTRVLQVVYELVGTSRALWPGQQLDVLITEDDVQNLSHK